MNILFFKPLRGEGGVLNKSSMDLELLLKLGLNPTIRLHLSYSHFPLLMHRGEKKQRGKTKMEQRKDKNGKYLQDLLKGLHIFHLARESLLIPQEDKHDVA